MDNLIAEGKTKEAILVMMNNSVYGWDFANIAKNCEEAIIPFIENRRLDEWTHNKTIQKATESYRITPERKEYLKSLKVRRK